MTPAEIRHTIYMRQEGRCLWCDKFLTEAQAHLHEIVPRSQGGKISLDNSIILCYDDHINGAHGHRNLQFRRMR